MRKKLIARYISDDGVSFNTEYACRCHEQENALQARLRHCLPQIFSDRHIRILARKLLSPDDEIQAILKEVPIAEALT